MIGAALIGVALLTHQRALTVTGWKSTQATLLYAYTQNLSSPTVAAANDWGTQKAIVKYHYSLHGHSYIGSKLMLLDFIYFPQDKIHIQSSHDNSIVVYVNPKKPSESIVYKDYPFTAITMIIIAGISFLLLGGFARKIALLVLNTLHQLH